MSVLTSAGAAAAGASVVILDDGFQHRRLARILVPCYSAMLLAIIA